LRAALFISAAVAAVLACASGAEDGSVPPFVCTIAPQYTPDAIAKGQERFPKGATILLISGSKRQKIVPGFYASADASVSFDGASNLFAGRATAAKPWEIWEIGSSGGVPRRIVQCETGCSHPLYLPDGRIAYTRQSAAGSEVEVTTASGGVPQRLTFAPGRRVTNDVLRDGRILFENDGELFTVYPDGTGVESLRCDHGPARADARQVSSGDVVFTTGGKLARFTSAQAVQVDVAQPELEPAGPIAEVTPGKWIVGLRKPGQPVGLYLWTKDGARLSPLETPAGSNAIQPAIVRPRTPPKEFPSALVDTRKTGNLLCLDARASRTPIAGQVGAVQVYTRDGAGAPILLGRQKVASDGSFYIEVPADRPLRIELLDTAGRTLRAEQGWFWMRPSEQRICVGCHTGPERAPENRVPEILLRTIVPEKMLGPKQ
jgi:hypothetical protein